MYKNHKLYGYFPLNRGLCQGKLYKIAKNGLEIGKIDYKIYE
jgi:hypothetical protein